MNYREIAEQIAGEDSHTLPNGEVVRFRQEPDEHTTLNDYDYLGRTEWVQVSNVTGFHTRPTNMDGCAEILSHDRGHVLWWQPPVSDKADRRRWHNDPEWSRVIRQVVRDVTTYGFVTYTVELCRGTDAYGKPVVVAVESQGGFEPCQDSADIADSLADLVRELLEQAVAA